MRSAACSKFTWTSPFTSLLKFQNGKGFGRATWGKLRRDCAGAFHTYGLGNLLEYLKRLAPCLARLLFAQWKPVQESTRGFQSEGQSAVVRADGAGGLGSGTRIRRHSLPLSAVSPLPTSPSPPSSTLASFSSQPPLGVAALRDCWKGWAGGYLLPARSSLS